jgi:cytochrome c peroxidase
MVQRKMRPTRAASSAATTPCSIHVRVGAVVERRDQLPKPSARSFDAAAAKRGDELFGGKAKCATCHVPPLYTEPGWNMHTADEIGIDDFQAQRAPDRQYRTTPLHAVSLHGKGGFYHDGRFKTLLDVVDHYDQTMSLQLSDSEKSDVVEYMKSL